MNKMQESILLLNLLMEVQGAQSRVSECFEKFSKFKKLTSSSGTLAQFLIVWEKNQNEPVPPKLNLPQ